MVCGRYVCVTSVVSWTIQTRKMVNSATASTRRSSREVGMYHHHRPRPQLGSTTVREAWLTFFFFSSSAERSSRAFSWLLRFFNNVSGTRISSSVGTDLITQSVQGQHSLSASVYLENVECRSAAEAAFSDRGKTRRNEFNR